MAPLVYISHILCGLSHSLTLSLSLCEKRKLPRSCLAMAPLTLPRHLIPTITFLPPSSPMPSPFSLLHHLVVMRLIKVSSIKALSFSPKRLFRPKKDRVARSRSDPASSFSYGSSSSSDASVHRKGGGGSGTPTTVLPGDWSGTNLEPLQSFKLVSADSVSRKQLEALLIQLGNEPPTRDEVALLLREVGCTADDHEDGGAHVSVEALLNRVGCGPTCDPEELRETFDFFDADHDGRITAEELLRVFTAMGEEGCSLEDCRRMIAEVDKNRDGFVCFEDFVHMMELQR